jgi:DNA-binding SARP family transcriptional activator
VRLRLLGGFTLFSDDRPVYVPPSGQRLLALLAVAGRSETRSRAAGVLWPDSSHRNALGNLRSALWRLRTTGLPLVEVSSTTLAVGEQVAVDLLRLRALLDRILAGGLLGLDELDYFRHDLLPSWYREDWVALEREHLRQRCLQALDLVSQRAAVTKRHDLAVQCALLAIRRDPLRESAQRILISASIQLGNYGEAVRAYKWFRDLLAHELGITPSAQLTDLIEGLPVTPTRSRGRM